jgi:Putative MetA-pathway of phenol degradation
MRSALALLFLAATAMAQEQIAADRPGVADGSRTVGRGAFELEFGWERDHFDRAREWSTPLLLRYGVSAPVELRVESQGFTSGGWAPPSVGVKTHFFDKPSLGVIARYFPPFRSAHSSADVRLAADVDLGETWALNPNVGVVTRDDGGGRFAAALAALTVEYNVTKTFNLFVDGALQAPEAKRGKSAVLADTGAVWIFGNDLQLDVEAGWRAHGRTVPNVFVGAGISRRF